MPGKLIAVAAHPGDGLFTMGAVLAQHIYQGGTGALLSLSYGEKGAPRGVPVKDYGDRQRTATERALRLLGAEALWLPYPDAQIPFDEAIALAVADLFREHKPETVITHWSGSWHKDHQNCHLVVRDAIFFGGLATLERTRAPHGVRRVYYADNWEDANQYQPDTYVDIDPVYEKWIEACEFYPMWRGQTGFRYNDYYSSLAVMRGCLSNFKHAVALMSDAGQRTQRLHSF